MHFWLTREIINLNNQTQWVSSGYGWRHGSRAVALENDCWDLRIHRDNDRGTSRLWPASRIVPSSWRHLDITVCLRWRHRSTLECTEHMFMSQGRKKHTARPGLESRTSRIPCEHSHHWATEPHGRPVTSSPCLIARNHGGSDETVTFVARSPSTALCWAPNVTGWGSMGLLVIYYPWSYHESSLECKLSEEMITVVDDCLMMTIYIIYIFVHLTSNIWNDTEIQNKLHGKHVIRCKKASSHFK